MSDKTLREQLVAHEKKVVDMMLSLKDTREAHKMTVVVLDSRDAFLAALADSADAPEGPCNTMYLVFVDEVEWSEVVGVFSSSEAATECKDWVAAQLMQEPINRLDSKVHVKAWAVDGSTQRGTWRVWIDLNGKVDGDPHYDYSRNVIKSYQMQRNDKPCGWAATGESPRKGAAPSPDHVPA